ncbi:MAG: cytochrome c-type biogenesis protein CcmH [Hyphomicrobiales bacterium]|nr:cytochrome c-type biogenesis protein CcmH [Hyphomicrobiales bacterium]
MVKLQILSRYVVIALSALMIATFLNPTRSLAVNPNEVLSDAALEQRARNLSSKLRCLVCQNQSIDDSDASLAKDLRILLRKRLVAGDSDEQVIDYIVSRYGEFVLLQPRFGMHTLVLWSLPVVLILTGFLVLLFKLKNRSRTDARTLSDEENARITELLGKGD